MRKFHCLCALFISLLLCACGNTADTTDMELQNPTEPIQQEPLSEEILFHSPEIEQRTRELLGKPEGAITRSEVLAITEFEFDSYEEISCEKPFLDLQWFCNLEKVDLHNCGISDISALSSLTQLEELDLAKNRISDISPLKDLQNLTEVYLDNNCIVDISPLENKQKLRRLGLRNNQINDIMPLCGLHALIYIEPEGNPISDSDLERFYEKRRDDLITVTHTGKLREDMPEFLFRLTAYYDLCREGYALQTVDVYQGDTLLQTISIPELTLWGETRIDVSSQDTLGFELEDVNFDGYLDIRLFDTLNGNYRVEWIYLVWNVEEQRFENDPRLNQISLASFNQEEQLIYGMERDGAVNHYYSTYQYIDGEIVLIRYYEEEGLAISDEQIRRYYEAASIKTDGVSFDAWYEHVMERNAASGELETVSKEYVFNPYDSDGKAMESEELRVDVSSELGAQISADISG